MVKYLDFNKWAPLHKPTLHRKGRGHVQGRHHTHPAGCRRVHGHQDGEQWTHNATLKEAVE